MKLNKKAKLCLIILFLLSQNAFAECYLTVNTEGNYSPSMLISLSLPLISKYIEPVKEIPASGISLKKCIYGISLVETRSSLSFSLIGSNVNILGESKKKGVEGIRQALLRALLQNDPTIKEELCKNNPDDLAKDCLDRNVLHINENQDNESQESEIDELQKNFGVKIMVVPSDQLRNAKFILWQNFRLDMFSLIREDNEFVFNYSVLNSSPYNYEFSVMVVAMGKNKNILWSIGTGMNYQDKRTTSTINDYLRVDSSRMRQTSFIWIRVFYIKTID